MDKEDSNEAVRLVEIRKELEEKRVRWRTIRAERLALKRRFEGDNLDKATIRKDKRYRELEKSQEHLSTLIKHIEKRLNRTLAQMAKIGASIEGLVMALVLSDTFPF